MIDLRSDTVTRPTDAMRTAAAEAVVGDDAYGEDPTVNELERTAADLLGCERALFLPSGTMGNQAAVLSQVAPGKAIALGRRSHMFAWEGDGLSAHAGVHLDPIDGGPRGLFTPAALADAIVQPDARGPTTDLVAIENTHNVAGGVAHDADRTRAIADVAAEHDLPLHLDGARLFNAAVARDRSPAALGGPADTVMCSLSKGIGAPVGSLLGGPAPVIERAREHRRRLGGGMRQAGMIAAPALVGLEDWERLAEDHRRATRLADGLEAHPSLAVNEPETNIVILDLADAGPSVDAFLTACTEAGLRAVPIGADRVRCCTHRDVDDADVDAAITIVRDVLD